MQKIIFLCANNITHICFRGSNIWIEDSNNVVFFIFLLITWAARQIFLFLQIWYQISRACIKDSYSHPIGQKWIWSSSSDRREGRNVACVIHAVRDNGRVAWNRIRMKLSCTLKTYIHSRRWVRNARVEAPELLAPGRQRARLRRDTRTFTSPFSPSHIYTMTIRMLTVKILSHSSTLMFENKLSFILESLLLILNRYPSLLPLVAPEDKFAAQQVL